MRYKAWYFLITTVIVGITSCNGLNDVEGTFRIKNKTPRIKLGATLKVELKQNTFQAIQFFVLERGDSTEIKAVANNIFTFKMKNYSVGKKKLSIIGVNAFGDTKKKILNVEVFSNKEPLIKPVKVINSFPHNSSDYTQGLFFSGDTLFESTGLYNESKVKKYFIDDQKVFLEHQIDVKLFGEGITVLHDLIYQLTWKSGKVLVYDRNFTLKKELQLPFNSEGWGITTDGIHLIMSDGSEKIRFLNPETLEIENQIQVYDNKRQLSKLNELELVEQSLFANIYQSNYIVEIDIQTGMVLNYIDCNTLNQLISRNGDTDVLNGIAYNVEKGHFFLTGKKWDKMFEVSF